MLIQQSYYHIVQFPKVSLSMKFNSDNPVCAMCPTLHERLVQRGMDSFLVDIDHRFGGQDIFALDDRLQADLVVMDPPFSWDVTAVRRALSAVSAPLVSLVQPTSERALGICSTDHWRG